MHFLKEYFLRYQIFRDFGFFVYLWVKPILTVLRFKKNTISTENYVFKIQNCFVYYSIDILKQNIIEKKCFSLIQKKEIAGILRIID